MGWVGVTHVRRHHEHDHTRGGGHLYQGRFKSFPVQGDRHLLLLGRRRLGQPAAGGNGSAGREEWPYSSLRWSAGLAHGPPPVPLAAWPVDRPGDRLACVNEAVPEAELERLRTSATRDRPFGDDGWVARTAKAPGPEHTPRNAGRPRTREAVVAGNQ